MDIIKSAILGETDIRNILAEKFNTSPEKVRLTIGDYGGYGGSYIEAEVKDIDSNDAYNISPKQ